MTPVGKGHFARFRSNVLKTVIPSQSISKLLFFKHPERCLVSSGPCRVGWTISLPSGPVIAPPAELVGAALGRGGDVWTPVPVEVRHDHLVGPRPVQLEWEHPPAAGGVTRVFKPDEPP